MLRIAMLLAALAGSAAAPAAPIALLPQPASMTTGDGRFPLAGAAVSADPDAQAAAARFTELLTRSGGPTLPQAATGRIHFVRDPSVAGAEAYRIVVTPDGATVSASAEAGLFYGAETLWQLAAGHAFLPAVTIADQPAFAWRGLMLDSVRHFQPVGYVTQLIDRMALAKLNVFHWHLTDDQGWRIPIDHYPRLISVGAWRVPAGAEGVDAKTGRPVRTGGFYTKAEIRAVVAYAAQRHITVVPEIEMPGHATALIAAYPELASTPHPPRAPSSDWGILPNLVSPRDASFTFLETVLDEVMELFPSPYIHVGGDEAPKGQWKTDPVAQARIRTLGLKDEDALQGWFTARIGAYLQQHGRRLLGWDEILEGGVPADATVMSWRGMDGALKAARLGHDTVLAPSPILYLDNRQSDSADEPPGRGEIIDWKRLYTLETVPATLTPEERRHILGLQATLFTEHVRTTDMADRMIWPRAAVAAELGWSSAPRDWPGFAPRLVADMRRWTTLGWTADTVPLVPEARIDGDAVVLTQPAGIGTLRYTLDGAAPTPDSPIVTAAIPLGQAARITARAFLGDTPLSPPRRFAFGPDSRLARAATEMRLCDQKFPLRLEDDGATDGVRRVHWVDVMAACWIWPQAPLDGVTRFSADVGSVPYNFALGDDIKGVVFARPATPAGELEVRQDGCDGPRIATIPLAPATRNAGDTMLRGPLAVAGGGRHDLCIRFTQKTPDPLWVLDRLTLLRR